jgi:hypothetical protein
MPRINLAEYFPQSTAQRTPTVSMHALDGEFEAGRNVANAAAGLAGTIADIDMKIRDARESADRRDAEIKLNAAADDFVGELTEKKDEDFDTWGARWDKRMGDTLKKLQPKTLSARGREAWGRMVEQFKVQSDVQIRNTRRVREAKVTEVKWDGIIKADIAAGNEDAAMRDIGLAKGANALSESQAETWRSAVKPAVQLQNAELAAMKPTAETWREIADEKNPAYSALPNHNRRIMSSIARNNWAAAVREAHATANTAVEAGRLLPRSYFTTGENAGKFTDTEIELYEKKMAGLIKMTNDDEMGLYKHIVAQASAKTADGHFGQVEATELYQLLGKFPKGSDVRKRAEEYLDGLSKPDGVLKTTAGAEGMTAIENVLKRVRNGLPRFTVYVKNPDGTDKTEDMFETKKGKKVPTGEKRKVPVVIKGETLMRISDKDAAMLDELRGTLVSKFSDWLFEQQKLNDKRVSSDEAVKFITSMESDGVSSMLASRRASEQTLAEPDLPRGFKPRYVDDEEDEEDGDGRDGL